ncbi:MAG: tol-pal system protein YbgF, partial [Alphaproteobacteria bacterium]|nr:tol-pal system protein YbgF [Alphaproteobacteria bacterium]
MKKLRFFLLACSALAAATPVFAQDARPAGGAATYNETRLAQQEYEIRNLNGRIEQIEYSVHRLESTMEKLQTDVDARIAKLEAIQQTLVAMQSGQPQPPVQSPSASQPQPPTVEPSGTLGALKLQNGRVTGGVNAPQSPPLPSVPGDYGLTVQEQYERAFGMLRDADYAGAEEAFKTFIEKNPKEKLVENARYWYGQTLYVRGRFQEAAVAFADSYQQNPNGSKAPDSLLKLGISLGA